MANNNQQEDEDYDFRGRRENEKVIVVVKYHAWLLMPIVYAWILAFVIMTASFYFLGASRITSIVITVLAVLGLLNTAYRWYIWDAGNYIITNQRVIRIEQLSLFNREISEAEIDRIQEISTEIKGPIRTMLGFGTVKIKTASNTGKVDLEDVTKPYDIQQIIAGIQKTPKDVS